MFDAFSTEKIDKQVAAIDSAAEAIEKQKANIEELAHGLDGLAKKEIASEGLTKAEQSFKKLNADIIKQSEKVDELTGKYASLINGELLENEILKAERALARTEKAIVPIQTEFESLADKLEQLQLMSEMDISMRGEISPQIASEIQRIQSEMDALSSRWGELENRSSRVRAELEKMYIDPASTETAKALGQRLSDADDKLQKMLASAENVASETERIKLDPTIAPAAQEIADNFNDASESIKETNNESNQTNLIFNQISGSAGKTGKAASSAFQKMSKGAKDAANQIKKTASESNGLTKAIEKTLTRIKNLLVSVLVFNVLRSAFKDLRDYIGAAMNQNKSFVNSLAQVKNNLKLSFQPILDTIIPILSTLMSWLAKATQYLAQFMALLTGKSLSSSAAGMQAIADATASTGSSSKAANQEVQKLIGGLDEVNVLAEETDDTGGAGGEAGITSGFEDIEFDFTWLDGLIEKLQPTIEALRELWETLKMVGSFVWDNLLNFYNHFLVPLGEWILGEEGLPRFIYLINDTLQAINWQRINDSLDKLYSALVKLGIFSFTALMDFYERFLKPLSVWVLSEAFPRLVDGLTQLINNVDFEKIRDALNGLWDALAQFGESIGEGLLWFYENVLVPLGTWISNEAIPAFLDALAGAVGVLEGVLSVLSPIAIEFYNSFLVPIAEWTGETIVAILEGLGDALEWIKDALFAVSDWMSENQEVVETITTIIGAFGAAWILVNGAIAIWNGIGALATVITTGFGAAVAFLTSPIGLVVLAIGALILIIIDVVKHWDEIKEKAAEVWDKIKEIWGVVSEWFNTNVITPLVNFFTGLWDSIKSIFSIVKEWFSARFTEAWEAIKSVFAPVGTFFAGLWDTIKEKFTTIGSAIGNAIGEAFKTVVNSIIGFAENTINKFISAINTAIGLINNIPGVNIGKLTPLSIPRLATGDVVPKNKEFLAILGDNKRETEVVSPISTIEEAVENVLARRGDAGGGITKEDLTDAIEIAAARLVGSMTFQFGEDEVGRAVIKSVNRTQQRAGQVLFNF